MDHDCGEAAINLSTNQTTRINSATTNGNIDSDDGEGTIPNKSQIARPTNDKISTDTSLSAPPPLLMMSPQLMAQQQMQQLLQHQVLSPSQIQQLLQQQQSLFLQQQQQQQMKQLESVIPQLQEQLQMNTIQQSQLLQQLNNLATSNTTDKGPSSQQQLQMQLQQLAVHQHQLIQQLQLSHRQYLLGLQPFVLSQGVNSGDLQNLWKDGTHEDAFSKSGLNGLHSSPNNQNSPVVNGQHETFASSPSLTPTSSASQRTATPKEENRSPPPPTTHPLYGHGVCKWPGCEAICDEYQIFMKHLNMEHQLDDRSTAQARVQMQVVSQLELQLNKEKDRLQAMMEHLHMKNPTSIGGGNGRNKDNNSPRPDPIPQVSKSLLPATSITPSSPLSIVPINSSHPSLSIAMTTMSTSSPLMTVPSRLLSSLTQPLHPTVPNTIGPLRRRLSDKGFGSGFDIHSYAESPVRRRVAERVNVDITEEIQRNREFYKTADVRPPFTYASLIRQSIIESPDKQLTLNEIYNWFQNTFCYFRRNAATWKNAVRHNLSLHKCFTRVENIKGAVWTVDEVEFYKRRPQRLQERIGSLSLTSHQDSLTSGKESSIHQNPGFYGENINASIQAALAESSLPNFLTNTTTNALSSSTPVTSPTPSSGSITPLLTNMNDTERYVMDLVSHRAGINNPVNNRIQIKQEPVTGDIEDQNGNNHYLVEEPEDDDGTMEEAEDLSRPSSEPTISMCP